MPGPFTLSAEGSPSARRRRQQGREAWIAAKGVHTRVVTQMQLEMEIEWLLESLEPGEGPVAVTYRGPRFREPDH